MSPFTIISILISISSVLIGNFIYYRNPKNQLNRVLALFSLFIAYMAFTDFQISTVSTAEQAYFWLKATFPWMVVGSFYIHLALISTEKFKILEKKITYVLIYLPALLLALLNLLTREITQGVQMGFWGWTYVPADTVFYLITLMWTFLLGIISAIIVLHFYLNNAGIKRQQAKYILIGIYLPLALGILTEFIVPLIFSIPSPSMLNLYIVLGLGSIVYGIWKFRLPQLTSSLISDRILSTMSNFLFLLDEEGKIMHVNLKTLEITGYSEKELIGESLEMFFKDIDFSNSYLSEMENMQTNLKVKNGESVPVLISSSLIKTSPDDILGVVMVGNDISQLKKAEEERDRYREHLEDLVKKRTEKLEQMNIQLKKEIIAHEKAEKKLKNSLDEKDILVKEIHHRVKNNLMIISSLLNIQAHQIKDEKTLDIFKESQNLAKSMAIIHERLYRTEDMRKIEFDDYIRELATDLFHTYKLGQGIEIDLDLEHVKIDVDKAIPLGLIINELITNSLKYAFPEGKGKISIQFNRLKAKDEFELVISDDGVGLPDNFDFRKA
ncbi:MAG: histidine kinase dimerization/phosphoacceptor domain -containing protein [Methanobacteriaceae archaeon]|nr:histidine kinase dimerization/phosphoacceptor domain -containing protein [Methanobacteriaceae archaeon]